LLFYVSAIIFTSSNSISIVDFTLFTVIAFTPFMFVLYLKEHPALKSRIRLFFHGTIVIKKRFDRGYVFIVFF
jgi:hypothetical protein